MVGQFPVSEVITEPSAVAPDARVNLHPKQVPRTVSGTLSYLSTDIIEVDYSIRRYPRSVL